MQRLGEDWGILLVAITLAILLPWWVIVLTPFLPLLLIIGEKLDDVVGDAIAQKVSEAMLENLRAMRGQPTHSLRLQSLAKAALLAEELQNSEKYRPRPNSRYR